MKIILAKFKFGDFVTIRQFAKFSFRQNLLLYGMLYLLGGVDEDFQPSP